MIEDACPGYTTVISSEAINTQVCATGYESTRCSACTANYYQLNSHCYFFGSSVDQSRTITITVLVGVGAMTLLAFAVSTLSSLKLAQAIQIFSLCQGAATVGVAGAHNSPYFAQELQEMMTYLNFSSCLHYSLRAHTSWPPTPSILMFCLSHVPLLFSSQFRH